MLATEIISHTNPMLKSRAQRPERSTDWRSRMRLTKVPASAAPRLDSSCPMPKKRPRNPSGTTLATRAGHDTPFSPSDVKKNAYPGRQEQAQRRIVKPCDLRPGENRQFHRLRPTIRRSSLARVSAPSQGFWIVHGLNTRPLRKVSTSCERETYPPTFTVVMPKAGTLTVRTSPSNRTVSSFGRSRVSTSAAPASSSRPAATRTCAAGLGLPPLPGGAPCAAHPQRVSEPPAARSAASPRSTRPRQGDPGMEVHAGHDQGNVQILTGLRAIAFAQPSCVGDQRIPDDVITKVRVVGPDRCWRGGASY